MDAFPQLIDLFPVLDSKLIRLLESLTVEEWQCRTVARSWSVKDVAAHLLDGNIRGLSISRDGHALAPAEDITSYAGLVALINRKNMEWTDAAQRISPKLLVELLAFTGRSYHAHLQSLDPYAEAVFPVAWAGHQTSPNWFHIAREYTEKFLHQQQIRDAVNQPGILTRQLYYPFLDTLMHALPYTFREVEAKEGTTVTVAVTSEAGGEWTITKSAEVWQLGTAPVACPTAKVTLDPDTAWKLFSKSWSPIQALQFARLSGEHHLAFQALHMVAVMA